MRENVVKATVGEKSLKDALKRFQAESFRLLRDAAEAAVVEATVRGEVLARETVSQYPKRSDLTGDLPAVTRTDVTLVRDEYEAEIILQGENAIFFEFGAGQYYNRGLLGSSPNPNPKGATDYYIGSYSEKTGKNRARQDEWYLPNEVQDKYGIEKTHGVMAVMPLHETKMSIINIAKNRAKG